MEYNPRDERELRSEMVLTPGEYDFEVVKAIEKQSKAGNDMIELHLRIFADEGERQIRDWLVPGSTMGDLKLNRFSHATGLQETYFANELSGLSCQGASGRVKLTVTSSEQYGDQNAVKDYIVERAADESSQAPVAGVPAQQTKRALKSAAKANEKFDDAYEKQLQEAGDDVPF